LEKRKSFGVGREGGGKKEGRVQAHRAASGTKKPKQSPLKMYHRATCAGRGGVESRTGLAEESETGTKRRGGKRGRK